VRSIGAVCGSLSVIIDELLIIEIIWVIRSLVKMDMFDKISKYQNLPSFKCILTCNIRPRW